MDKNKYGTRSFDDKNEDSLDLGDDDDDIDDLLYDDDIPVKSSPLKSSILSPPKSLKAKPDESPIKKAFSHEKSLKFLDDEEEKEGIFSANSRITQKKPIPEVDTSLNTSTKKELKVTEEKNVSPKRQSHIKNPIDLFLHDDEAKYLGDLGVDKLDNMSPTSGFSNEKSDSFLQKSKLSSKKSVDMESDGDSDILDSLGDGISEKSPTKSKRQSFMDDLLGKPTTKASVKKLSSIFNDKAEEPANDSDKDEIMTFGSYVHSAASSSRRGNSNRRQSVMFKDDVQLSRSPLTSPSKGKLFSPEKKEQNVPKIPKSAPPVGRRPRADNQLDDIFNSPKKEMKDDLLDFLKDSKINSPKSAAKNPPIDTNPVVSRRNSPGRKGSSTDWLDLKENSENIEAPIKHKVESKLEMNSLDDTLSKGDTSLPNPGARRNKSNYPWLSQPDDQVHHKDMKKETLNNVDKPSFTKPVMEAAVKNVQSLQFNNSTDFPTDQGIPSIPKHSTADIDVPSLTSHVQSTSGQHVIPQSQQHVTLQHTDETSIHAALSQNAEISRLQSLVTTLQFEKKQLMDSLELLSKKRDEDLKKFEENLKAQQKSFEDSIEIRLKSTRDNYDAEIKDFKKKLKSLEEEKTQLHKEQQFKNENLEKEHRQEMQKLKELHTEAIAMLKQSHEDAITRLKHLKDQEVEAISSSQLQTKSLQSLSDQLQERASELASLRKKVEEKHQVALQEKESILVVKEKELKALEKRLHWQMEEGEQERNRLQNLVLHLEKRLQQQTKQGEETHWDTLQLKTKLEVQKKFLEEEKRMFTESLETEKEKLRASQTTLFAEQRAILSQLAQERQQLSSEKQQLELLAKRIREEETRLATRKLKEESSLETQRRMLEQETEKAYLERQLAKQETLEVQNEKQTLERMKRQLADEKERIHVMELELKRRSSEVEAVAQRASLAQQEGQSALATSRRIEAEHHSRIAEFTKQMQEVVEMQRNLIQEREKFNEERREFEKMKSNVLCINCKLAVGFPMTALPPDVHAVQHAAPLVSNEFTRIADPNRMVWYITAEKDREYIQQELAYLKSLKKYRQE